MSKVINDIVDALAETCYINQLRSDAAFHKKREIKNILMAFQGIIIDKQVSKSRDMSRRLYVAEKAIKDAGLVES